jgi:hypothetical protein
LHARLSWRRFARRKRRPTFSGVDCTWVTICLWGFSEPKARHSWLKSSLLVRLQVVRLQVVRVQVVRVQGRTLQAESTLPAKRRFMAAGAEK